MGFSTYAEINLDNLGYNTVCIREKVAPAALIPVVKADAYGHGAVPVVKRLASEGCAMFAVARLEEALELRESGISQRILLLGRLFPPEISQALKAGLTLSIFGHEDLLWVEKACESAGKPKD
jgi:alanine racemase